METPSLWYLLAHPASVGIALLRPVLLGLALAAPLFFLRQHPSGQLASALRAAAYLCLVAALAGMHLTARLPSNRLTLIAAVDMSESVDQRGQAWAGRYLNEVADALAPGDELAVLAFAGDVALLRPPSAAVPIVELAPPGNRTATDLGRAIDSALALFPADGQRSLLLLTDGNETRGHSRNRLARLRAANVRLHAAVPPRQSKADVRVGKLVVPRIVAEESVVRLRVIAHNTGAARPALLNLYLDGLITDSTPVELHSGVNALDIPMRIVGQGAHRLRAELVTEGDATPGNNYREVGITVRGKTRLLLITPHPHSPLALALQDRARTDVRAPEQMPQRLAALLSYHAVLLEDVAAAEIPPAALGELERYVRDIGGGFILVGGGSTFGDPQFGHTPLAHLLPVTLEPRRPRRGTREPLALFLVIDRSNSMGYNSRIGTLRDGEKLRYAKEAALAVIRQLKDRDLVGVVAFDSKPHEISPLRPLRENRAELEDLIPRLVENGGTDFYDALLSARRQLAASRVTRRHVVLLTDGDTNRASRDEYRSLIEQIAAAKISVTTIRIGDDTVNVKLLQDISRRTEGSFHHVEDAATLPELILRDTSQMLAPATRRTQGFYPQFGSRNQVLRGIEEQGVPALLDYAYARPKAGAEVPLHIARLERRDPLLAVWHYGLGRVAAFTASPSDDAEQWPGWTEYAKFWSQLVHWTARAQTGDEYAVDTRRSDGVTEITVRASGPRSDDAVLLARLHLSTESTREVSLVPSAPRAFTARVTKIPGGRYPMTIVRRSADGTVSESRAIITIPSADDEPQEEHRRAQPNMSLLTYLTQGTGGSLDPTARELVKRPLGTRRVDYPLDWILLPLAMLLFLGDVAVRRLRIQRSHPEGTAPPASPEDSVGKTTPRQRGQALGWRS